MVTILIVEDNEMNRDMLSRRLIRKGYLTVFAIDGQSGIRLARTYQPDLILMDMSLPDMMGSEATHVLKADRRTRGIPIIALTAHATESARLEALAAGCDEYETKPLEFDALLAKMAALLHREMPWPRPL
jgi:two-component system, cell cycle response regulator DivK